MEQKATEMTEQQTETQGFDLNSDENIAGTQHLNEQVEEEATTGEIVDRLKLAGDAKAPLFMLDSELKTRKLGPTV